MSFGVVSGLSHEQARRVTHRRNGGARVGHRRIERTRFYRVACRRVTRPLSSIPIHAPSQQPNSAYTPPKTIIRSPENPVRFTTIREHLMNERMTCSRCGVRTPTSQTRSTPRSGARMSDSDTGADPTGVAATPRTTELATGRRAATGSRRILADDPFGVGRQ